MNPARLAYAVAVTSYLALILHLIAWIVWLDPPQPQLITPVLLAVVGPLLPALPGILRQRRYTLAWSTMLVLLYFVHGVVYASGAGVDIAMGLLEVIWVLGYFTAANAYLRLSRRPATPVPDPESPG